MASTKVAYGSSTPLTLMLASLASSATAGRECTAVDNSSNLYIDALVQVKVALQSGTPADDKAVYVYAYGAEDGATYSGSATGSDAAITLKAPTPMQVIGIIPTPDSGALTYKGQPMSVAAAFGGYLPRKWGIVVRNYSGVTLSATEGDHSYKYTGVYYTSA